MNNASEESRTVAAVHKCSKEQKRKCRDRYVAPELKAKVKLLQCISCTANYSVSTQVSQTVRVNILLDQILTHLDVL